MGEVDSRTDEEVGGVEEGVLREIWRGDGLDQDIGRDDRAHRSRSGRTCSILTSATLIPLRLPGLKLPSTSLILTQA
jgi:hypothetical protein